MEGMQFSVNFVIQVLTPNQEDFFSIVLELSIKAFRIRFESNVKHILLQSSGVIFYSSHPWGK